MKGLMKEAVTLTGRLSLSLFITIIKEVIVQDMTCNVSTLKSLKMTRPLVCILLSSGLVSQMSPTVFKRRIICNSRATMVTKHDIILHLLT